MKRRLNEEQLRDKIADVEKRMAREWRFYGRYSEYLVILKLRLQTLLNAGAALARKQAVMRRKQVLKYLEQRGEALRKANYFAWLRLYCPFAYSWGC